MAVITISWMITQALFIAGYTHSFNAMVYGIPMMQALIR
jgi:hypothetical protein